MDVDEPATHSNAIDVTPGQDGGCIKVIKREGSGQESPVTGDKVVVHYVGTLEDGSKFDSSRDRNDHFEFNLGKGEVIKSWDLGVATMKKGELCTLTCKPEYAYGDKGSPPKIPPMSTLIFEVELFDWRGEDISPDKNGSIVKSTLEKGEHESYISPNEGAYVEVHLTGRFEGRLFDDRDLAYYVGEDASVCEGIEIALKTLKRGEKARLTIKPQFAFEGVKNLMFNVPKNATVTYDVLLKQFEKSKDSWQMDATEKLEQSEIVKNKGTRFFKEEDYTRAIKWYKVVLDYLDYEDDFKEPEQKDKCKILKLAVRLNLAMSYLKLNDSMKAIDECNEALKLDENNVKAYFRRGLCHSSKGDFNLAVTDFKKVLELEATNKAARNQIELCHRKMKEQKEKEKKLYSGMF